jgi:hypothetical protein
MTCRNFLLYVRVRRIKALEVGYVRVNLIDGERLADLPLSLNDLS